MPPVNRRNRAPISLGAAVFGHGVTLVALLLLPSIALKPSPPQPTLVTMLFPMRSPTQPAPAMVAARPQVVSKPRVPPPSPEPSPPLALPLRTPSVLPLPPVKAPFVASRRLATPPLPLPPPAPPQEHSFSRPAPKVTRRTPVTPPLSPTGAVQTPVMPPAQTMPTEPPAPRLSPSWQRALSTWLVAHRVYPALARARGEQGNVTVRFTVEPSGQVIQVIVVHSSGSSLLDAAAKAMLRGARVPPFPGGMPDQPATATVEIRYALER